MKNPFKRTRPAYMRACYIVQSGVTNYCIWLPYSRKEYRKLNKCIKHNLKVAPEIYLMGWIEYGREIQPQKNPVNYHTVISNPAGSKSFHQTKPSN